MSNARYLEIDSTYRDRSTWPLPGEFEIPISQSGRKGPIDAVDPVSEAAAEEDLDRQSWQSNALARAVDPTGTPEPLLRVEVLDTTLTTVGDASGTLVVNVQARGPGGAGNVSQPGSLHTEENYYVALVGEASTADAGRRRVLSYTYLGNDRAQFIFATPFSASVLHPDTIAFTDPTDFSDLSAPYIFIPSGRTGQRRYPNTVLYNETHNEWRPLQDYSDATHMARLDVLGSSTHDVSAGPITNAVPAAGDWLPTDTYSIRVNPPWICPLLAGDPVNNPPTTTSFNLPVAASRNGLVGSFIEKPRGITNGVTAVNGSQFSIPLAPAGSFNTLPGFYVGCEIRIIGALGNSNLGQRRTITGFDGAFVTVSPGFPVFVAQPANYIITCPQEARRIVKYVDYRDTTLVAGTVNTIDFPPSASNEPGFYNNLYVVVNSGAPPDIRLIRDYQVILDGAGNVLRRVVSVWQNFTAAPPAGTGFTITSGAVWPPFSGSIAGRGPNVPVSVPTQVVCILQFSYDNLYPFVYTGSLVSQQEMVCYEVELLNLVLPNLTLATGGGGRITFYPYVYVELQNVSASGSGLTNVIYSNNPNAAKMTFRAAIDDVPNPLNSTFLKIDGDGMVQTIKFKPNDNLKFAVRLQNGDIYQTEETEDTSPCAPNPRTQISAVFSMRRL